MHKPLLIYNGKDYLGMCTNSEFFESLCPISYDKMTFIDSIVDETILTLLILIHTLNLYSKYQWMLN